MEVMPSAMLGYSMSDPFFPLKREMIDYVIVMQSFNKPNILEQTVPPTIQELHNTAFNARLILLDCSTVELDSMFCTLRTWAQDPKVDLIIAPGESLAVAKNMALNFVKHKYQPNILTFCDDDHGIAPFGIDRIVNMVTKYYGRRDCANPHLRFGLFGCSHHMAKKGAIYHKGDKFYHAAATKNGTGVNDCFRTSTFMHWLTILGEYPVDGYPISFFQCSAHADRNYHAGFTSMKIDDICFCVEHEDSRGSHGAGHVFRIHKSAYHK